MTVPAVDRRLFIQGTAAASLGYLFTAPARSQAKVRGSNDRIKVAGIGVGGKGRSDLEDAARFMEVTAICDIDESKPHLGWAKEKYPRRRGVHRLPAHVRRGERRLRRLHGEYRRPHPRARRRHCD